MRARLGLSVVCFDAMVDAHRRFILRSRRSSIPDRKVSAPRRAFADLVEQQKKLNEALARSENSFRKEEEYTMKVRWNIY